MADPVATVEKIVKIGLKIKDAVDTVRSNEEECQEIKKRVLRFSAILSQLQQTGMMNDSPALSGALDDLEESLQHALELVTACQETSTVRRLFTAGDLSKQLRRVKEDILNKVMLASFAINTHTTIVLLTIQAGGHPHPPSRQQEDAPVGISHSSQSTDNASRSELNDMKTNILAGNEESIAVGQLNLISGFPRFSFSQILAATNKFSSRNYVGEGGFGDVYKGQLCNGRDVAVKRYKPSASLQGEGEFIAEIKAIEHLLHRNVIVLLGICDEGEEKILVYEYMPKKCLATIISDKTEWNLVNWTKRLQIIQGIANGLAYLHGNPQMCIVHRDIKSGNILLDHEMNAKISDFGLAVRLNPNVPIELDPPVCGTYGYAAPEYIATGKISPKQDVYGFGILLLEILGGKLCRFYIRKSWVPSLRLPEYAHKYEKKPQKFVDPVLRVDNHEMAQIVKCFQVALLCIHKHAGHRPTMSEVATMLGSI